MTRAIENCAPKLPRPNIVGDTRPVIRVANEKSNATWEVRLSTCYIIGSYFLPHTDRSCLIQLGVDNPRPPPCVRCRRESKRCEFSATRRKRKTSDAEPEQETPLRRDKRMMVGEVLYGESSSSIGSNGKREPSYGPTAPAPFDNGNLHKYAWPENSPHTVSQASPIIQKDHHQHSPVSASHYHDGRGIQSSAYQAQHSRGPPGSK